MNSIGIKVRPGERVRAEHINALVDGLRKILEVRTGAGIQAEFNDGGLCIALASAAPNWIFPARIISHTGADPDYPTNVKYTVRFIGEDVESQLTQVYPSFGRPVKGAEAATTKIRPAADGAFCLILQDRDSLGAITAKLILLPGGGESETVYFEPPCA